MSVNLDLIVPGLFDLPLDTIDRNFIDNGLPSLNQILTYATKSGTSYHDLESILATSMGWPDTQILPLAQALAEQSGRGGHHAVLFRPVHLHADLYNAIVTPIHANQRNSLDIGNIIRDLGNYFKVDCDVVGVTDDDWLMQLSNIEPPRSHPHYLSILGRKADPYVEQSKHRLPWYQLVNEMQMFMHQHSVNQERLSAGLPIINSLWFWGSGNPLDQINKSIYWFCEDELLTEFARKLGLVVRNLNDLPSYRFSNKAIAIDLSVLEALKVNPQADLEELLSLIENNLLKPLLAAVDKNDCRLRLRSGFQHDYQLTRFSKLKRWRGPANLTSIVDQRVSVE